MSQQKVCFHEGRNLFQPTRSSETTPRPLGRMLDHFGIHSVVDDITAVIKELFFSINQPCFVSSLQDRSDTLVFPVVELAVELVELFHPWNHVGVRGFKGNVVVRAHEAKCMACPVVFFDDSLHEMNELFPVLVVMENGHLSDASAYDMIHGTWILNSQRSGHFGSPFFVRKREQE